MIGRNRLKALAMLEAGLVSLSEAAELAGVSRQSLHAWCRRHGVEWKAERHKRLTAQWERASDRPRKKPSRAQLRHLADESKVAWDLNHEQDRPSRMARSDARPDGGPS